MTRKLKQAVKRKIDRFPNDFMFELTHFEMDFLVTQSVIPSKKYFGGAIPFAFTEQGVSMLSSVLTTKTAVEVNIAIFRAFTSIDRKTRLVFIKIYDNKSAKSAEDFLENITNFYPFKINKILTDNGKEFTDKFRPNTDFKPTGKHIFDKKCKKHKIEHRLTKSRTPKTNGMV